MKTVHGRLALLAFVLAIAALLFMPMRAGVEDVLTLSPEILKMSVGGNYRLQCVLRSDNADQSVRFESSDAHVASVDTNGTVYALSGGETVVTAIASGGATAQMQVRVDGVPMTALSLNVDSLTLGKGEYSGLKAIYNEDASDTRLQWISDNENVAKVSQYGQIEGVGGGECTVSVISPNGLSASARVLVEVEGTAVHVSPNELTLGVGAQVQLNTVHLPTDSTDKVVSRVSSNPQCAYVDDNNVLHAVGIGDVIISVKTKDGATSVINVSVETAPKSIQLSPNRATIARGDTLDLQLRFFTANGEVDNDVDHLVVWKSSDESVATIDENGCVTALRSGSTRITATADGMMASCRLNVEVFVREITLDRDEIYLLKEDTAKRIQLNWSIDPVDADDPSVSFASDNEQVATVDENGIVTLTGGYGSVTITATAASGVSDSFTIHVVTQLPTAEPTVAPTPSPSPTPEPASVSGMLDANGQIGFADEDDTEEDDTDQDDYISTGIYPWEKKLVVTPAPETKSDGKTAPSATQASSDVSSDASTGLYPWEKADAVVPTPTPEKKGAASVG